MSMRRTALLLLLLLPLLGGCGFQPRGQAAPLVELGGALRMTGLSIQDPLYRELQQALQLAGADTTAEGDAAAVLRISDRRSTSRVLSVDSRNKVVEYELEESFLFSVRGSDGSERIPEQRLITLRILLNPQVQVLGRNREADLIRIDMRRELANRLVERLAAQL
ncbi:MAG: LPS-assembly lipoprotein [Pseudomonadota bacterium]|jgi:LPS-assembly lipoprotein